MLASLSPLLATSLEECHDSLLLPGLTTQDIFDFILVFTEEQKEVVLTESIRKVIDTMGVTVFQVKLPLPNKSVFVLFCHDPK